MNYIESRSFNLPATVTNKRSYVAKELVEDLIKNIKDQKFLGQNFFLKLFIYTKKMINIKVKVFRTGLNTH